MLCDRNWSAGSYGEPMEVGAASAFSFTVHGGIRLFKLEYEFQGQDDMWLILVILAQKGAQ